MPMRLSFRLLLLALQRSRGGQVDRSVAEAARRLLSEQAACGLPIHQTWRATDSRETNDQKKRRGEIASALVVFVEIRWSALTRSATHPIHR
jgi:hypothetical protein